MRLVVLIALVCGACQDSDVSRAVGARCDVSAECEDRCLAPSDSWPGGFCTLTCDTHDDCPADAVCIDEDGSGVCAFKCFGELGCVFLGREYECIERSARAEGVAAVLVCRG